MKSSCTDTIIRHAHNYDIAHDFKLGKCIGAGSFGSVYLCRRLKDGQPFGPEFAVKSIDKKQYKASLDKLVIEIEILRDLSHPNIVNMYEVYEDVRYIYIVLDYFSGG